MRKFWEIKLPFASPGLEGGEVVPFTGDCCAFSVTSCCLTGIFDCESISCVAFFRAARGGMRGTFFCPSPFTPAHTHAEIFPVTLHNLAHIIIVTIQYTLVCGNIICTTKEGFLIMPGIWCIYTYVVYLRTWCIYTYVCSIELYGQHQAALWLLFHIQWSDSTGMCLIAR